MKARIFIFLMLMLPMLTSAQAQNEIENRIDVLLQDRLFVNGDVSLAIYDLDDGKMICSHREKKSLRPASVQKVLTAVVALEKLGVSYTFDTELYERSTDDCRNLYVKGRMDPLFDEHDMKRMAAGVPAGTVIDTLFADCSFIDSLYWGSGWVWDDNPYGFQPYLSPLMVCKGAVEVKVKPSARGRTPEYMVTPESSFYSVVNEAKSNDCSLGKLTILRDWLDDSNLIRIKGNCKAPYKESINMYKSADFFLAMLVEKLSQFGIEVRHVAFSRVPDDADVIYTCKRNLANVVDEALMESDNLCAEALLYHLGAIDNASPLSMDYGCEVLREFIKDELDIDSGFNIADGSGLSVYDYLTAEIILEVLKHAYEDKECFDVLYAHLPQSGISGTMKNRTKGNAAYKKVRAKTGTVKGVCSLAGYALGKNGNMYAFVMINSGLEKASKVREWQDKVLDAICK